MPRRVRRLTSFPREYYALLSLAVERLNSNDPNDPNNCEPITITAESPSHQTRIVAELNALRKSLLELAPNHRLSHDCAELVFSKVDLFVGDQTTSQVVIAKRYMKEIESFKQIPGFVEHLKLTEIPEETHKETHTHTHSQEHSHLPNFPEVGEVKATTKPMLDPWQTIPGERYVKDPQDPAESYQVKTPAEISQAYPDEPPNYPNYLEIFADKVRDNEDEAN